MPISQFCNEKVIRVGPEATAQSIAKKMKMEQINDVIVEDRIKGKIETIGIITDRDIVIEAIAEDTELSEIKAREMIYRPPVTVPESCGIYEAIETMENQGVRRLLVLKKSGEVLGLLNTDNLFQVLGDEFNRLGNLLKNQSSREKSRFSFNPKPQYKIF
jgi:signal-transduction protein with cAMP-binding, CBS, and nucleotidyltransferase domain